MQHDRLRAICIWIAAGILFLILRQAAGDAKLQSALWALEYPLIAFMIIGVWVRIQHKFSLHIKIPRAFAPLTYVFFSWALGMIYEMTLTIDGTGIGGMHRNTIASFILAQGDYLSLALLSLIIIRRLRLSFEDMFMVAGGVSLTEGLFFTGALLYSILSPQAFLAPLVFAYYMLVYGIILAAPLLFLEEALLLRDEEERRPRAVIPLWIIGIAIGFCARVFWGLVYGPVIHSFILPAL